MLTTALRWHSSSAAPKDIAPATGNPDDCDVRDDGHKVGRIHRINAATEIWWWRVSFQLTGRKSYEMAPGRKQEAQGP